MVKPIYLNQDKKKMQLKNKMALEEKVLIKYLKRQTTS